MYHIPSYQWNGCDASKLRITAGCHKVEWAGCFAPRAICPAGMTALGQGRWRVFLKGCFTTVATKITEKKPLSAFFRP